MRHAHHAHSYANTMAQQQPQRRLDPQQQQGSVNEYQSLHSGARQMGEDDATRCDHGGPSDSSRIGLRGE